MDHSQKTRKRKLRVAVCTAVLLLCIPLHYIAAGCPPLNLEHQFRRAEKAQWVGPAYMLGTMELENARFYDRVLLADDAFGVTMYLFRDDSDSGELHYRTKTGDLTVLAVPNFNILANDRDQIELPIIAFNRNAKAVRAELELVVDDGSAVQTYHAEAKRENEGYFCFTVSQSGWTSQVSALRSVSEVSSSDSEDLYRRFPVTVRLYDQNGQLLQEENREICSPALEAQDGEKGVIP